MDVTSIKLAELELQSTRTELAHVMRVTRSGELTASIAHEVNQPLGAVVANAGRDHAISGRVSVDGELGGALGNERGRDIHPAAAASSTFQSAHAEETRESQTAVDI